jgi:hypothetical protein
MNPYFLCRHCDRHIKRGEAACPFCGQAKLVQPSRRGARAIPAQWLAYGSALTALGCTNGAPAQPPQSQDATTASVVDARGADDTAVVGVAHQDEATTEDAPADAAEPIPADAAEPMFAPADGNFPCYPMWVLDGSLVYATCDRATQYCFLQGGIDYSPDGCRSFDCGPNTPSDAGCGSIEWDAAACGSGVRRCSCLLVTPCSSPYCSDDDAGGVVLGCGQCYGAPPAREWGRRERAGRLAV